MSLVRIVASLAAGLIVACSSPPPVCVAGVSIACVGPGGCAGAQVCDDTGSGYGLCDCGDDERDAATPIRDGGPVGPIDASASDAGLVGPGSPYTFPSRDFACGVALPPPCATTEPLLSVPQRTVTLPGGRIPDRMTFVFHVLQVGEAEGARAAGLNLDQTDSGEGLSDAEAECEDRIADFLPREAETPVGVDNALSVLIPVIEGFLDVADCDGDVDGCSNRMLQEQVDAGTAVFLLQIDGVDSLTYDNAVRVTLYRGSAVAPVRDVAGRLVADQSFNTTAMLAPEAPGDIFQGRLRVRWSSVTLPSAGTLATSVLYRADLRFDLSETEVTGGVLAGTHRSEDVVDAFAEIAPDQVDLVRGFLATISDVSPSSIDPRTCEEISTSFTFEGRRALRAP